ncbi:MAG: ArsR/SmtB family transcription factor [Pseudomonadota bacterium]
MKKKSAVSALAALAQETRLDVFRLLVKAGPDGLPAGRISEELSVAPATLSFHLTQLANAGLARSRQEGRYVIYSADFDTMAALLGFLSEDCCGGAMSCAIPACPPAPSRARAARKKSTA